MVLLGIIVPALVFFAAINVTYSYFTARSAEIINSTTTSGLLIKLTSDTQPKINSTAVTGTSKLLPGDTLSIDGSVENAGTHTFYAIFEFTVVVTKAASGSAAEMVLSAYYTIVGSTATQIVKNGSTYSATAFLVEAPNEGKTNAYTKAFSLPFTFDGETYNDDYKNANVSYTLKAVAIQSAAIGGASAATDELINMAKNITV